MRTTAHHQATPAPACCARRLCLGAARVARRAVPAPPPTPPSRRAERHHRLVAHPEQRSGHDRLAEHGRRLHGRAPERDDQHHGDGERGVQGRAADQHAGRRRPRPVPVLGRRRPARSGRRRRGAGHHRRRRPTSSATSAPARPALFNVDGKQYGVPYNAEPGRLLVQQGPLRAGRHRGDRRRRGTSCSQDVQTLKDAGITPIAVGAGDKWPAHFWYSYLMVRLGGADAMNQIAADNNFSVPQRDRGRREGRGARRHEPVPGRLPRRRVGRPRR